MSHVLNEYNTTMQCMQQPRPGLIPSGEFANDHAGPDFASFWRLASGSRIENHDFGEFYFGECFQVTIRQLNSPKFLAKRYNNYVDVREIKEYTVLY